MRLFSLIVVAMFAAAWFAAPASANGAAGPTYGTAVVDGAYGEWNLAEDFFCAMYRDGDGSQPLLSKLYLRYDCLTSTLYLLVLTEPGVPAVLLPREAWVAIVGRSGRVMDGDPHNDGWPVEFAWVDLVPGGDWPHAWGFEAGFTQPEGFLELIVHLLVFKDYQYQSSATPGYPDLGCQVLIDCGATPVLPATWGRIKQAYR